MIIRNRASRGSLRGSGGGEAKTVGGKSRLNGQHPGHIDRFTADDTALKVVKRQP
jgi:hypothetical protein